MQLANLYHKAIYWRTFNENDTAYLVGLHDGILQPQQSVRLRERTKTGRFQLELKHEHLWGRFIHKADPNALYGEDGSLMVVQQEGIAVHFYHPVVTAAPDSAPACQALYDQLAQLQAELGTSTDKPALYEQIKNLRAKISAQGC